MSDRHSINPHLRAFEATAGRSFAGLIVIAAELQDLAKLEDWIRTSVLTRVPPMCLADIRVEVVK